MKYNEVLKKAFDFGLEVEEDVENSEYECNVIFINVVKDSEDPSDFIEMLLKQGGKVDFSECMSDRVCIGFETFAVYIDFFGGAEKECKWLKDEESEANYEEEVRYERCEYMKEQLGWC